MDIYGICWQNSEATILGVDLALKLVVMEVNLIGMIALLFPQISGHKAELLLLKLIHLFAREVLLVKMLEIEETKTTYLLFNF